MVTENNNLLFGIRNNIILLTAENSIVIISQLRDDGFGGSGFGYYLHILEI